jgi:hypothetical protein
MWEPQLMENRSGSQPFATYCPAKGSEWIVTQAVRHSNITERSQQVCGINALLAGFWNFAIHDFHSIIHERMNNF